MNFVFISPHFPPNFSSFCIHLKNYGANVLGIGDGQYSELKPELKAALTEYYYVESLSNYDSLVRAIGYFTHKYGKIDRIESHNEFWLEQDAWLREDFNIFGQRPRDLEFNRSKLGMKEKFEVAKVPAAKAIRVTTNAKVKKFVEEQGFPLIVKPDVGVGAQHTYKVKSLEQLNEYIANMPPGLILEKFVEGPIVTFDGLANIHGEIIFCASMAYNDSVMDIVNKQGPVHYTYRKDMDPGLEEYGKRMVSAFNVKERFFHFELFNTEEGYKALEVNIRPPGGFCMDMLNYMCDIDLYKDYANLVVNDDQFIAYKRKYNVGCVAKRDRFTYKHSHEEIMNKYKENICFQCDMPKAFSAAMGDYVYMFRHESLDFIKEAIAFVEEQVQLSFIK